MYAVDLKQSAFKALKHLGSLSFNSLAVLGSCVRLAENFGFVVRYRNWKRLS